MRLTQAAPGHNGARVARGDTLKHSSLVHRQGEVLRPHENHWLLVGPRARAWEEEAMCFHFSCDPSHLIPPTTQDTGSGEQDPAQKPGPVGQRGEARGPRASHTSTPCSLLQGPLAVGAPGAKQTTGCPG